MLSLEQEISSLFKQNTTKNEISPYIVNNLNPKFELRDYQMEAFVRFNYVLKHFPKRKKPTQLLFHMATGSGKTLIMAGIILDLYKLGYRHFIFFVNSSNIIDKTKDNFLNPLSSKYLFNENIHIENKNVKIKETDNFEITCQDDINIIFTTIQGLHSSLNNPKENALTYEDFIDKKIVLLSDEAHHINAETKKGKNSKEETKNIISWEATVNKIFNSNPENLLLEFTATADLQHPEIKKKYFNKLIFDYPLRQFHKDKYSKEVQVLQADLAPFERALQAIIISQYRKKIFEKNRLNIKPVILLKSEKISSSKNFYNEFIFRIKNLNPIDLINLRNKTNNKLIQNIFEYLEQNNINFANFVLELKEDFSEDKCISVNSKNDSIEKQLIINSLEDESNKYRVVFAVDKLNEGWDVLNLFDIVRLYDTRDSKKIKKTSMSEAQLIGRGARYCPFKTEKSQSLFQRKFDDDTENELRICEELYYHSAHNPAYISELNKVLEDMGIKSQKNKSHRKKRISNQKTVNKKQANKEPKTDELDKTIRNRIFQKKLFSGYSSINKAFEENSKTNIKKATKIYYLRDFQLHILHKALNKIPFYRFENLQKYFPNLESTTEFFTSEKYALNIKVKIEAKNIQLQKLNNQTKLEVAVQVFNDISELIINNYESISRYKHHYMN